MIFLAMGAGLRYHLCARRFGLQPGWVAEWFNAAVLKTAEGYAFREFESHPIRSFGYG